MRPGARRCVRAEHQSSWERHATREGLMRPGASLDKDKQARLGRKSRGGRQGRRMMDEVISSWGLERASRVAHGLSQAFTSLLTA